MLLTVFWDGWDVVFAAEDPDLAGVAGGTGSMIPADTDGKEAPTLSLLFPRIRKLNP
jgi:hypothetical protein